MKKNAKRREEEKDVQTSSSMPLSGHLRELRNRVVICIVALLVCSIVFLNYAEPLVTLFTDMGTQYGYVYVYLAPQELLIQYLRVAVVAAICVCLPLTLYQIWAFARPGLSRTENLTVVVGLVFGLLCFIVGVLFAYKITLPFMLYFLINLGTTGVIEATISVEKYISFVLTVLIIFGCVFEMPMVSLLLTRLGILKPSIMVRGRKIAIVIIFLVAAIITPPDIFSQVMVAVPMILLWELSILLCRILYRWIGKKEAETEQEEA